jgi:fructose-1,6-bisphosphatase I
LRDDSVIDMLPKGRDLLCSGYAIYGPSTMLVLTFGDRVDGFTLDDSTDSFVLTHPNMTVPQQACEFAINVSRQRHWDETIQSYVGDCLKGPGGSRQKEFNMRWTASMVADVHRILVRGGVFLYPVDADNAAAGGKLRLLYEAMPMAMIVEAAGGGATDGRIPLLDVSATTPHQRTSVILGAREEIELIRAAYS